MMEWEAIEGDTPSDTVSGFEGSKSFKKDCVFQTD